MATKDYYRILQVDPKASDEVIDAAWKALSKALGDNHPDRYLLNEAHAKLKNPLERKKIDEERGPPKGKVVRIGPYRLIDKIAEGGFGITYRAKHEWLDELVCIKQALNISAIDEALMLEEAKTVFNLRHWAIPALQGIYRLDDGSIAIAMSYIEGHTLQQFVEKHGRMDPEHVAWITERVLNALRYLHDHGVLHGDVKPGNIIVQEKTHQVGLVDYGLSLVKPGRDARNKGYTPMFASPEQKENRPILPESDLYSLGLTMMYALGGNLGTMKVPGNVPDPFCNFLGRLLVRNVLDRPNWKKENLLQTIRTVREESFGRSDSNMKPLVY